MFLPPSNSTTSSTRAWGSGGRPLHDRIVETLRYFSDEIESRRAGGLGEAQAAGYLAGRLRRAEYAAAVQSFQAGIGERLPLALSAALGAIAAGGLVVANASVYRWVWGVAASLMLVLALLLLLGELGALPVKYGTLRRIAKGKTSQNVIAGRAAKGKKTQWRVLIIAPLDGPPRPLLSRQALVVLLVLLVVELLCVVALLFVAASWLQMTAAVLAAIAAAFSAWILLWRWQRRPLPAIYGAGELATLLMVAEELEPLQSVEVWVVALGGSTIGYENLRALLAQYPFAPSDTCVINLHNVSTGQPVFVTREGLVRERRSDRMLLAAAADTDVADITIDAEPRRLQERTMANTLLQQRFRAITISSHGEKSPYSSPDPSTIERCVRLVVGMVRTLDT